MRLKKGFTLAEVLIVLMVIGAIATLTIPSLMTGVSEAQQKTSYKKALNNVVNISAMEKAAGTMPGNSDNLTNFFNVLRTNLAVTDYVLSSHTGAATATDLKTESEIATGCPTGYSVQTDGTCKDSSNNVTANIVDYSGKSQSDWIITEDGLAYKVVYGNGTVGADGTYNPGTNITCKSKTTINSAANPYAEACLVVLVDTNKISSGSTTVMDVLLATADAPVPKFDGKDIFPIFIGNDGATAGSRKLTVTGRIAADLK